MGKGPQSATLPVLFQLFPPEFHGGTADDFSSGKENYLYWYTTTFVRACNLHGMLIARIRHANFTPFSEIRARLVKLEAHLSKDSARGRHCRMFFSFYYFFLPLNMRWIMGLMLFKSMLGDVDAYLK